LEVKRSGAGKYESGLTDCLSLERSDSAGVLGFDCGFIDCGFTGCASASSTGNVTSGTPVLASVEVDAPPEDTDGSFFFKGFAQGTSFKNP